MKLKSEIYLEFETGETFYFSWCNEPVQYCIGFKTERFNENEPDHVIDATNWKVWRELIGQYISFVFADNQQLIRN